MKPRTYKIAIKGILEMETDSKWSGLPVNSYTNEIMELAIELQRECDSSTELKRNEEENIRYVIHSSWNSEAQGASDYGFTLSEWAILCTMTGYVKIIPIPHVEGAKEHCKFGDELEEHLLKKGVSEYYWFPMIEKYGDDMARLVSYRVYDGRSDLTVRMVRHAWENMITKLIVLYKKKCREERDIPPTIFNNYDIYDIVVYAAQRLVDMGDDDTVIKEEVLL